MSYSAFVEAEKHEKRMMAAKRPHPGDKRLDPEEFLVWRTCGKCGGEWTVPKRLPAAANPTFTCPSQSVLCRARQLVAA